MEQTTKLTNINVDKTTAGNLTISLTAVQKLIFGFLVSENYQVNVNDIKTINNQELNDLEVQIKMLVPSTANLADFKQKLLKILLKRINSVLNVNISNINLMLISDKA